MLNSDCCTVKTTENQTPMGLKKKKKKPTSVWFNRFVAKFIMGLEIITLKKFQLS